VFFDPVTAQPDQVFFDHPPGASFVRKSVELSPIAALPELIRAELLKAFRSSPGDARCWLNGSNPTEKAGTSLISQLSQGNTCFLIQI
jgi:hypothetical protein